MKRQQFFEAQTALLRLERRSELLKEERKQAKYDLRCRDDKLLNYQGGIRSFLDKLSGKQEEKLEALRREVRNAESTLQSLQREQESLAGQREELTQLLSSLPSSEELRAENEQEWAGLEAKLCAEALPPLLEENRTALLEYRSLLQGSRMEILTVEQKQKISAEPDLRARKCLPWLNRLKEAKLLLGESFDPGSYYASPEAYLVSVVAKHNRLDRVNQAITQVEALQSQLQKK